ncbi:MAG: pirin family protein [Chloroflexota bacterium]
MITLRRSAERGHATHGWLESYHTFSFANYYDPRFMGFRVLRVINQDRVAPGRGFGMHSHDNMEVISYVLEGAIEHRDTMGSTSVLRPGEVQVISAGTGMAHSEYNPSDSELLHFLQVWIVPNVKNLAPAYQQQRFPIEERRNRLRLVCSPDGRDGSTVIRQDAAVYASVLDGGQEVTHGFTPGRYGWVHVARGAVELNGHRLEDGDGASVAGEALLALRGERESDLLLFDLP